MLNRAHTFSASHCRIIGLFMLFAFASSILPCGAQNRLIFEEQPSMRSSFCLFDDGKFYDAQASGCVGQLFSWGHWTEFNDTLTLRYSNVNVFKYSVIESEETNNSYQVIKVIDCYNQPVRQQYLKVDTSYLDLYNTGLYLLPKGRKIIYCSHGFGDDDLASFTNISNADTITFQWHCNRECIESISAGSLTLELQQRTERAIISKRRLTRLR
ncbi:MAG: hypothetical protein RL660_739 [Bacteroidota bacterium]|jgi:hypothetical protein